MENNTMNTTMEATTKKVSYRQDFIRMCSTIIENEDMVIGSLGLDIEEFNKFKAYFDTQINKTKTIDKGEYKPTEKAHTILEVLIAYSDDFITGKVIAENSNGELKANGVSGSIRALITNGMVEATSDSPKKYRITQKGIDLLG